MGHTFVGFLFCLSFSFLFYPKFSISFSPIFLLCVCIFSAVLSSRLHWVHVLTRSPRWAEREREREAQVSPSKKCFKRKISCTVPTDSPAAWPLILALFSHIGLLRCVKIPGLPFDCFLFQKENIYSRKENPFLSSLSFLTFSIDL